MKMASLLYPVLRFYQVVLYIVAKPSALLLDKWLGQEGIHYFREQDLREIIKMHMISAEAEVDHVEGAGALNFLAIDDLPVMREGEPVDPASIIPLEIAEQGLPIFPEFIHSVDDSFLRKIEESGKKWVIIVDEHTEPQMVLDADGFFKKCPVQ